GSGDRVFLGRGVVDARALDGLGANVARGREHAERGLRRGRDGQRGGEKQDAHAQTLADFPAICGDNTQVPFDPQPALTGRLLHLRPMRRDDFDALYAVASDPLIWAQHPASDRYKPDVFRAFFDQGLASGGALVATDATDGRMIGSSRYF